MRPSPRIAFPRYIELSTMMSMLSLTKSSASNRVRQESPAATATVPALMRELSPCRDELGLLHFPSPSPESSANEATTVSRQEQSLPLLSKSSCSDVIQTRANRVGSNQVQRDQRSKARKNWSKRSHPFWPKRCTALRNQNTEPTSKRTKDIRVSSERRANCGTILEITLGAITD